VAILKLPLADLIFELRTVELMSKRIRGVLALEKLEGEKRKAEVKIKNTPRRDRGG
jgi:hypothetical protein